MFMIVAIPTYFKCGLSRVSIGLSPESFTGGLVKYVVTVRLGGLYLFVS